MNRIYGIMMLALSLQLVSPGAIAQWTQSNFPVAHAVTDLVFFGNSLFVATSDAGIYQTQNFSTWTASNSGLTTLNIHEIITSIEGSSVVLYAATDAGIFRSTLLGYHWTPVNNGLTSLNAGTVYSDGSILYAGTSGGTFRSSDFGQSWTPMLIGLPTQQVRCFHQSGAYLFAGLIGQGNYLYRSTDQGLNWEPYGSGLYETGQIRELDNELFAVSITLIYTSTDQGASWNPAGPGLVPGMPVADVTTGNDYWWVATFAGGYVQHTDSSHFRMITAAMPMGGLNLSAVAQNSNWIVYGTINNGIWYASESIVTGQEHIVNNHSDICISPNPVDEHLQVRGAGRQNQEWMYAISDLSGRILQSGKAWGEARIRLIGIPSGSYMLTIHSRNKRMVNKFVKL